MIKDFSPSSTPGIGKRSSSRPSRLLWLHLGWGWKEETDHSVLPRNSLIRSLRHLGHFMGTSVPSARYLRNGSSCSMVNCESQTLHRNVAGIWGTFTGSPQPIFYQLSQVQRLLMGRPHSSFGSVQYETHPADWACLEQSLSEIRHFIPQLSLQQITQ